MSINNKRDTIKYVRIILLFLALTGGIAIAMTSPFFLHNIMKAYFKSRKFSKNSFSSTFSYLKREGLITIEKRNQQVYISLTEEGKKRAGKYQINDLTIHRPKRWDGKWRVVIFDIGDEARTKREALRGKLKDMDFYQLQKSVWVHPFDCAKELALLKEFFALSDDEMRILLAEEIGADRDMRKRFRL